MQIHIVQKGETIWNIAKKYGISFEELKRLNTHLANPDYIVPGMEIFLPHHESPMKQDMRENKPQQQEQSEQIKQPVPWPPSNQEEFYPPWDMMPQYGEMPPMYGPPQWQQPMMCPPCYPPMQPYPMYQQLPIEQSMHPYPMYPQMPMEQPMHPYGAHQWPMPCHVQQPMPCHCHVQQPMHQNCNCMQRSWEESTMQHKMRNAQHDAYYDAVRSMEQNHPMRPYPPQC